MKSDRGSVFYLCERAKTDKKFETYPRLPMLECAGFERRGENEGANTE